MGSTLSSGRFAARRRRKTTSAAKVDYQQLNGHDACTDRRTTTAQPPPSSSVTVGRAKRASRLLAALTSRKSAAVATLPADGDVTSGNGAHGWHQHNNDSGYYEVQYAERCLLRPRESGGEVL